MQMEGATGGMGARCSTQGRPRKRGGAEGWPEYVGSGSCGRRRGAPKEVGESGRTLQGRSTYAKEESGYGIPGRRRGRRSPDVEAGLRTDGGAKELRRLGRAPLLSWRGGSQVRNLPEAASHRAWAQPRPPPVPVPATVGLGKPRAACLPRGPAALLRLLRVVGLPPRDGSLPCRGCRSAQHGPFPMATKLFTQPTH